MWEFKKLNDILDELSISLPGRPQDKRSLGQCAGAGLALTLAAIVKKQTGVVIAIVPDSLAAAKLERELSFFLNVHPDHELHKKESNQDLKQDLTQNLKQASKTLNPFTLLSFPDWETLPYDSFSPHQDIISERLTTLYRLPTLTRGILIVSVATLMHRLCPREFLIQNSLIIKKGDKIDLDKMRQNLAHSGYFNTPQVSSHGEFAIRGSILDLYPMGSSTPYRIDLFDQEIDSIRTFDLESQRSDEKVDEVHLLPAREYPLDETAISYFRSQFRDQFEGDPRQSTIYLDVSEGHASPGLEYYLPLFFEKTASLFDYLPKDSLIVGVEDLEGASEQFWEHVKHRYEQFRHDRLRPILEPKQLFLQTNEFFQGLKEFPYCKLTSNVLPEQVGAQNLHFKPLPELSQGFKRSLIEEGGSESTLVKFIHEFKGLVLFTAETAGRREVLKEILAPLNNEIAQSEMVQLADFPDFEKFVQQQMEDLKQKSKEDEPKTKALGLAIAPLDEGVIWDQKESLFPPICIIPEAALFGKRVMQRRLRKTKISPDFDFEVQSLAELSIGAPIVHLEYGIGRYLGLSHLILAGQEAEFLTLEYAGGDKLYIPVTSLHLVSRYSGVDIENAPLSRLGSGQWEKIKRKVMEETHDIAAELLEIYAKREAKLGQAFNPPDQNYQAFSAEFPFEETPDQERAIQQVIQDMISAKPMDRVVCGDVGFGKTEVALRAAFLGIQNGKQVAVLVPTTLLAEQHFQTFSDRFANFPVRVEVLSRFKNRKEQEQIIQDLEEGKIDIIIGTHKLLQDNIRFKTLGLLIIDEEHRFGVQQKETFKKMRSEVNILTLTATPIPRTLNMSMSGMRDLSIIATPPARRLSVKTFVRERNKALIEESISRELYRGGQVYYLHNTVETIDNAAHELGQWLPNARIAIAHGQMRERELEQVMSDFYHRRHNVLVCTTIIETGIDIPTANTIIIERADKFGLAQLHQLRGRVGRSHHQAYAFCLTPPNAKISSDAKKRLDAIESLDELGVGFTLATHDLEIRGAGELLGEEQSGNIQSVGFPLFMELLEHTVKMLKSEEEKAVQGEKTGKGGKVAKGDKGNTITSETLEASFKKQFEIDLHLPSFIPESYLPDVHSRLLLYKRIANAKHKNALDDLMAEMIDRFGPLTHQIQNLFKSTEIKLKAQPLGIVKIDAGPKGGRIEFGANPNVDPMKIIRLIQEKPKIYRLEGPHKIRVQEDLNDPKKRVEAVMRWLSELV